MGKNMAVSVNELQARIASLVDQDPDTSNISTDDYALRLKYLNMALHEWQEIWPWQTLYSEYNMLVSTSTGNASIALPANFRKLSSYPVISYNSANTDEFPETRPQEGRRYLDTDRRIEILGNPASGYVMRVYGATLVSGASVKVPYFMSAQSLASPADIAMIPNAQFLEKRVVGYLWEAREDPRFPEMKAEADKILANMIEYETVHSEASEWDRVRTVDELQNNFRVGRD